MTGKGKEAGQSDLQEPHQVGRRSTGQDEYGFFTQHTETYRLTWPNPDTVKHLLPSDFFKDMSHEVVVSCPGPPAGDQGIRFTGQFFHGTKEGSAIFEKEAGNYFNTAFVIGAKGEIIGRYRKVHVPQIPLWEEKAYFKPGDLGFPVFKTPFAAIGVQICWDVFFPEGFRILALKGAEVIFVPTASAFEHSQRKWERAIMAAAHANGVFILRVNRIGKEERQEFYGRSFCAGPDGEFVNNPSGASPGVVLTELDLGEVTRMRNEWVFLKDRRPEEYKEILEIKG